MEVGPITDGERDELRRLFTGRWGSERVVSRGRLHEPLDYPTLVARHDGRLVGALSYEIRDGDMQAITLDAFEPGSAPAARSSKRPPRRRGPGCGVCG